VVRGPRQARHAPHAATPARDRVCRSVLFWQIGARTHKPPGAARRVSDESVTFVFVVFAPARSATSVRAIFGDDGDHRSQCRPGINRSATYPSSRRRRRKIELLVSELEAETALGSRCRLEVTVTVVVFEG